MPGFPVLFFNDTFRRTNMNAIWNALAVLLQVLLPMILNRKPDTMEDSAPQKGVTSRLQSRIRSTWGSGAAALILLAAICPLGGCMLQSQVKTVYVKEGDPVRIRETIKGAKVWVMDKDGTAVPGVMDLPDGWYALPLSDAPVPAAPSAPAKSGAQSYSCPINPVAELL